MTRTRGNVLTGVDVSTFPVISEEGRRELVTVLSQPFSYVSTVGSVWRSYEECEKIHRDPGSSFLIVRVSGELAGAVGWRSGQTPGFIRMEIVSAVDELWSADVVADAIGDATAVITRSSSVHRLEFLVPGYDRPVLEYLLSHDDFLVEGILADRFFIDGRYWDGILCRGSADLLERGRDRSTMSVELVDALYRRAARNVGDLARHAAPTDTPVRISESV